jgi:hypothetical protein
MAARPKHAATRPDASLTAVIERGFSDGVAERLARGPFTYSDRAALLARGQRLGIDRVRGNALIADQQIKHQNRQPKTPVRFPGALAMVGTFVAVQGSITAAIAWALHG